MVDTQRVEQRQGAASTEHGDGMPGADTRAGAMRRIKLAAVLGVVALAVLGYASFEFVGHATASGAPRATATAGTTPQATAGEQVPRATANPRVSSAPAASRPAPARPAAPRSQLIVPASVAAFGPGGTADGDDPQNARNVIADPASGWQSDWYTTASFGSLKAGTGLLLDLGRTVTITSVRIRLGGPAGARLQLRLGAVPALAGLHVARTATAASDLLTIRLPRPVAARYVLLWFTMLPPDGTGTYQVSVHQVTVDGRR